MITEYVRVASPTIASEESIEVGITRPQVLLQSDVQHLPLVIFLHGWGGSAHTWEHLKGPETMSKLVRSGAIPEMVVTAPNGKNAGWINWKEKNEHWEDFLAGDLLAAMKLKYPISGCGILGTSMGARARCWLS